MSKHITFSSVIPRSAHEVCALLISPEYRARLIPPCCTQFVTPFEIIPGNELTLHRKTTFYEHTRSIVSLNGRSCELKDEIVFWMPFSGGKRKLKAILKWQHETIMQDLATYANYPRRAMRILVSGSSGMIGSQLVPFLKGAGHEVIRLVRSKQAVAVDAIYWNPETGELNKEEFEGFDVVIHLAGANITSGRWTKKKKQELFLSRCRDTWLLSHVLCRLYQPPKVVLCASAVGFYGDRGNEHLTEKSVPGRGFLAEICSKWEEATCVIEKRGARVVHMRFGTVLSGRGGMLKKLLPAFRLGLGAKLADATPMMSWIALDDVLNVVYFALMQENLNGPLNVVSPQPLTQPEFTDKLAGCLGKKAWLKVPKKTVPFLLGEMGQELLLCSSHVVPERLLDMGYSFSSPTIEQALSRELLL